MIHCVLGGKDAELQLEERIRDNNVNIYHDNFLCKIVENKVKGKGDDL